jgi:hypothetical protein
MPSARPRAAAEREARLSRAVLPLATIDGRRHLLPGRGQLCRRQRRRATTMAGYDLILKGGRVIDPSQNLDGIADVAFAGGKVAAVGKDLKAERGTEVRNVAGFIVSPGLIDLHTHVYWGGTSLGIDA